MLGVRLFGCVGGLWWMTATLNAGDEGCSLPVAPHAEALSRPGAGGGGGRAPGGSAPRRHRCERRQACPALG